MFRVSENIELYGAKLGIESAAFEYTKFYLGPCKLPSNREEILVDE